MKENMYRDIYCGEVDSSYIGKNIRLAGWVNSIRNLGNLVFITLRDETGIVQLISEDVEKYKNLHREATVTITGVVEARTPDMVNKNMKTGEIEVKLETLEVLGDCVNVLPFEINKSKESNEDTRLKYRYLDLRNKDVHDNIIFRSKIMDFLRKTMKEMDFLEVQTPIITATSPEGARDFIIPSRKFAGKFYALPQSPQIFKQLLMVSGFNKYFQIAPCFRDEDARADRCPGEFYQLDMEMSYATQEDVFSAIEPVIYNTFSKFSTKKIAKYPFPRIAYKESMLKYGTDKPDLRNPLYIIDLSEFFKQCTFKPFINRTVRAIKVNKHLSKGFHEKMLEYAMSLGMPGLGYLEVQEDMSLKGPIDKFIPIDLKEELIKIADLKSEDTIFFIADNEKRASELAGQIRTELGKRLELIDENSFQFAWIVDFPMYELEDDEKIAFCHNPFSMPQGGMEALLTKKPLEILAYQYDIVCNGIELSSGAVRNHDPEIMVKAFEIAGYTKKDIEEKFSALFNAFQYGAPPHAGIAPGVDRMLMLLTDAENIREVIAFPMNSKAEDLMMGAPGFVTKEQLRELNIRITETK